MVSRSPSTLILTLLLILFGSATLPAQSTGHLLPVSIDVDHRGDRTLGFYLFDRSGSIVPDPGISSFVVTEGGQKVRPRRISCPKPDGRTALSSLLLLDVSGSMGTSDRLERVRSAASLWIRLLPLGHSEAAIVAFDHEARLLLDLSTDEAELLRAIDRLAPEGGTSFDNALLDPHHGALPILERGREDRVVIFLTDGTSDLDVDRVLSEAGRLQVTIHIVLIDLEAPDDLRRLADGTGGLLFDEVSSVAETEQIFRALLASSEGRTPCELVWPGVVDCDREKNLTIAVPSLEIDTTIDFSIPSAVLPSMRPEVYGLDFGEVPLGSVARDTISLTAGGSMVRVEGISLGHPDLHAISTTPALPAELVPGSTIAVVVEYRPTDDRSVDARLSVISNICDPPPVWISGGRGSPIRSRIRLLAPNGGEVYHQGDPVEIRWELQPSSDTVILEVSADAGATWSFLSDTATGGSWLWEAGLTAEGWIESDDCLVRVRRLTDEGERGVRVIPISSRVWDMAVTDRHPFVVLGGDDGFLALFDAAEGTIIAGGENIVPGNVRSVAISPDGMEIAAANGSGLISFRNLFANRSDSIRHTAGIRAVYYTPDGLSIVGVDDFGSHLRFDRASGALSGQGPIRQARGGPLPRASEMTDRLLLKGESKLYLVRRSDGSPIDSVDLSRSGNSITYLDLSRDGSVAVAGSEFRQEDLLLTHTSRWTRAEFSSSFRSSAVRLSRSGLHIGYATSTTRLPDRSPLLEIVDRDGHRRLSYLDPTPYDPLAVRFGPVSVAFDRSDRYAILSRFDTTLVVVDRTIAPTDSDVSDGLFAVRRNELTWTSVDVGRAHVGSTRDSLVRDLFVNRTGRPLRIDSVAVRDPEFSILAGGRSTVLGSDEGLDLEIGFTPADVGVRISDAIVYTERGFYSVEIRGTGFVFDEYTFPYLIDFGHLPVGERRDTVIRIAQVGPIAGRITVTSDRIVPDIGQFSSTGLAARGGGLDVSLSFQPTTVGRIGSALELGFEGQIKDGTQDLVEIRLVGEGLCRDDIPPLLSIGDHAAEPGSRIQIPIVAGGRDPELPVGTYSLLLEYDASLLLPLDSAHESFDVGELRRTRVSGRLMPSGDTIAVLPMIVGLGRRDQTPIRIVSATFGQYCLDSSTFENGRFELLGVCRAGGDRFFHAIEEGAPRLALYPPQPNPIRNVSILRFSTIEAGLVRLELVDARGDVIKLYEGTDVPPGHRVVTIDRASIPSGHYIVRLVTATQERTTAVVVE